MDKKYNRPDGSVVLFALCFVAVLAISVASYISMGTQSMQLSNRSFQTTLSEHLAEMGLEQAIACLNANSWSVGAWPSHGTNATWSFSGTTATGTLTLPSTKFGSLGVTGLVNIRVDNYTTGANARMWDSSANYTTNSLVSFGGSWYKSRRFTNTNHTPSTSATYWTLLSPPKIHAEGVATLPSGSTIKTQLVATMTVGSLFPNALGASVQVIAAGGGTVPSSDIFDGYNASLGTYKQTSSPFSSGSPNFSYSAVLAGGSTTSTAVTLSTGVTVNGYVAAPSAITSPYGPQFTSDATAVVKGTSATPSPKVDATRVSRSPYIPQFSIQSVTGASLLTLHPGSNSIGTSGATTPTKYYLTSDFSMSSGDSLTINGPVVIDITGSFKVNPGTSVIISSTGSAEIHCSTFFYVYLGGVIRNDATLDPKKFIILTPTATNCFFVSTTSLFYGVIYAPNAYVTLWSGGVTIYGAISASTIECKDTVTVHYDTSLRTAIISGVDNPFIISTWRQLTTPSDPDHVAF